MKLWREQNAGITQGVRQHLCSIWIGDFRFGIVLQFFSKTDPKLHLSVVSRDAAGPTAFCVLSCKSASAVPCFYKVMELHGKFPGSDDLCSTSN